MRRLCPDTETKKTMNPTDRIHIDRLCERIHKETDPMLFTELVIELNHFLERNECQQRATRLNGAAGMALPEQNPYLQFRTRRWLSDLLGATIVATDADFGDVQLFDSTCGALRIVAHEGFENEFLEYFETVDCSAHCPCGAAMSKHSRVVVADVATDSIFAGGSREMLLRSSVRSVQSTPLIDMSGRLVGMVSTHYRRPDGPQPDMWAQVDQIAASFMWRAQDVSR